MQDTGASEDEEVFRSPAKAVAPLVDLVEEDEHAVGKEARAVSPEVQEVPGPAEESVVTPSATPGPATVPTGATPGSASVPTATPNPFDAFDANVLRRSTRKTAKRKSCTEDDDTPVIIRTVSYTHLTLPTINSV